MKAGAGVEPASPKRPRERARVPWRSRPLQPSRREIEERPCRGRGRPSFRMPLPLATRSGPGATRASGSPPPLASECVPGCCRSPVPAPRARYAHARGKSKWSGVRGSNPHRRATCRYSTGPPLLRVSRSGTVQFGVQPTGVRRRVFAKANLVIKSVALRRRAKAVRPLYLPP